MRFSLLLAFLSSTLTTTTLAAPTDPTNFLLVTTTSSDASQNPSDLKAVSATSLYDPFNQPALLLRLIGPGYGSLPNFTLTSGTLSTFALAPFGGGIKQYNSTVVEAGKELQFLASAQPQGNLGLEGGYLLTVDGQSVGWTVCDGPLGDEVLSWKGNATGCSAVYMHAVMQAPY